MNEQLKTYSFNDLLKQGKIRIPKIQRDYAQGKQKCRCGIAGRSIIGSEQRGVGQIDFGFW